MCIQRLDICLRTARCDRRHRGAGRFPYLSCKHAAKSIICTLIASRRENEAGSAILSALFRVCHLRSASPTLTFFLSACCVTGSIPPGFIFTSRRCLCRYSCRSGTAASRQRQPCRQRHGNCYCHVSLHSRFFRLFCSSHSLILLPA